MVSGLHYDMLVRQKNLQEKDNSTKLVLKRKVSFELIEWLSSQTLF